MVEQKENHIEIKISEDFGSEILQSLLKCPQGLKFTPNQLKIWPSNAMLDFTIEFESENFTIKAIQLRRNNFEFEWMLKYLLKYYSTQIEACHIESFPLGTLMGVMERLSQILKSNSSTHLNEYQNLIVEQSASCLCYFFQSATYAIFNSEIYLSDPTVREFFSLDFPLPVGLPSKFDMKEIASKISDVTSTLIKNVTQNSNSSTTCFDFQSAQSDMSKILKNCPKIFNSFYSATFEPMKLINILSKNNDEDSKEFLSSSLKDFGICCTGSCFPLFSSIFSAHSRHVAANHLLNLAQKSKVQIPAEKIQSACQKNTKEAHSESVKDISALTASVIDKAIEDQRRLVDSIRLSIKTLSEIEARI